MLNKNSVQFKKSDDRKKNRRGFRTYPVPEVVNKGPLVWLGDEDPCKFCDAMDGKVDGEGWSSLRGPQWWKSGEGYWESLGKGRISGTPPIHPNCQCRLVSMAEWLEIRRKELQWVQRDEDPKKVRIPVGDWGPNDINYFKWQREEILKDLRAFREMKKLMVKEEKKRKRELERLAKKEAEVKPEKEKQVGWFKKAASVALDAVPVMGVIKGVGELITGVDSVTGEKIGRLEGGISLAVGIIPIPGMRVVGKFVGRKAVQVTGKLFKSSRRASKTLKGGVTPSGKKISERLVGTKKASEPRKYDSEMEYWFDHVNVKAEEKMKGHSLRHHGVKTDKELKSRLQSGKREMATAFKSEKELQDSVRRVLRENSKEIKKWAKGKRDMKSFAKNFSYKFKSPVGRGIDQSGKKLENLKTVTVRVHKRKGNLRLVTTYLEK